MVIFMFFIIVIIFMVWRSNKQWNRKTFHVFSRKVQTAVESFSHVQCWFTTFPLKNIRKLRDLSYWRIMCWEWRVRGKILWWWWSLRLQATSVFCRPFWISTHLFALSCLNESKLRHVLTCDSTSSCLPVTKMWDERRGKMMIMRNLPWTVNVHRGRTKL